MPIGIYDLASLLAEVVNIFAVAVIFRVFFCFWFRKCGRRFGKVFNQWKCTGLFSYEVVYCLLI